MILAALHKADDGYFFFFFFLYPFLFFVIQTQMG